MKLVGKILLAALLYIVGTVLSGVVISMLKLPPMTLPEGFAPQRAFMELVAAAPLLAASLIPLRWGLGGAWLHRWFTISLLMYVAIGLNTALEGSIFSTMMSGHFALVALQPLLPCVLAAAVLALPFKQRCEDPFAHGHYGPTGWAWRLGVGCVSFLAVYWCFGMLIAPLVMNYYRSGVAGLRIPDPSTIVKMQLLRGTTFVIASLPVVLLWTKSRRAFIVSLGLAYAVSVGIFQLAQADFMPGVMRIVHSFEITADSFAYAAVLGYLFIKSDSTSTELKAAAGS